MCLSRTDAAVEAGSSSVMFECRRERANRSLCLLSSFFIKPTPVSRAIHTPSAPPFPSLSLLAQTVSCVCTKRRTHALCNDNSLTITFIPPIPCKIDTSSRPADAIAKRERKKRGAIKKQGSESSFPQTAASSNRSVLE